MMPEARADDMPEGSGVDFPAFYRRNGMQWGAGDMFVVGPYRVLERFAELITVLAAGQDEDGAPAVSNILLVRPPGIGNEAEFDEVLREEIRRTFLRWRGTALDESEERALARRLNVTTTGDMQVSSVLSVIEAAPARIAIIVTQGALYRAPDADGLAPRAAASAVALPEDFWVPHFYTLCQRAIEAARQSETYVALDAGEEWPARDSHRKLLLSIDGCGVVAGAESQSPDAILATRIDDWNARIAAGEVGAVLSEIDALPSALDRIKPFLRLQALEKAGFYPMVLSDLRNRPELTEGLQPATALQVAQIASESGAPNIAETLLANVPLEGLPREHLDNALLLAERIGVPDVLERCKALLSAMYPSSPALRQIRIKELFAERQYGELARLLAEGSEGERAAAEMYGTVAEALQCEALDYAALLRAVESRVPSQKDRAKRILSREALLRGRPAQALQTVLPDSENADVVEATASSIVTALERVILTRDDEGDIGVAPDTALIAISHIVRYLAHHPADGPMRVRLVDVMSAQSMGGLGVAALATVVLNLARESLIPRTAPQLGDRPATSSPEDVLAFMRVALPWLSVNGPIYLGRTTLPAELLTGPPDELIEGAEILLANYEPIDSATDAEIFEKLVAAAISIVPHGTDTDADLTIIRIAAMRLSQASRFQKARDYAEHALQLAGDDRHRARLAWLCFGDVYERTGKIIHGLVAIACGLSADRPATPEQVWYESLLLFRLMRDLQMIPFALSFLEAGRDALQDLGALDEYGQRIDTLILQAHFLAMRQENGAGAQASIESLFGPIVANARAVLERHDEPEPVAALLSEAIRQAAIQGVPVSSEATDVLGQLVQRCSPSQSAIITAIGEESPSADQVLTVLKQIEEATQADDTAYDVRTLAILAERLLAGLEALADPWTAAFAVELLADHAISQPVGNDGAAQRLPQRIEQPGDFAADLSRHQDLPAVMIGMDSRGLLLRTTVADGTLHPPVREAPGTFSKSRLTDWSQEFPFRYGIDTQAMNLFYTSTEGIGVSELPERAVLVMSVELQQYPANLLRLGSDLAGFSRRLAVAPSLTWLSNARAPNCGPQVAWIPTAGQANGSATLTTVVDRVRDPLAQYGVALDEGATIPASLRGAELAIVTAHGSLVPEGRFFQVVHDDSNLKAASAELSDALGQVGVAIFFVCSGGRMDKHPMANTTLGLARQLLGNGCAAVVASPWPLDSRVPSYWIPTFLERWHDGSAVIDAVFDANASVRDGFSREPRDCLAMHLYGDPLRRKSPD
jgi:hypothetical protein